MFNKALKKLKAFDVQGRLLKLMRSWLEYRKAVMVVNGTCSKTVQLHDQAFQGTVWDHHSRTATLLMRDMWQRKKASVTLFCRPPQPVQNLFNADYKHGCFAEPGRLAKSFAQLRCQKPGAF